MNTSDFDLLLQEIAEYVTTPLSLTPRAAATAGLALLDSLGVALLASSQPRCRELMGSLDGASCPDGVPIPGMDLAVPMVDAAFDISTLIRWLDFNDTWLAAEWGHPSDNLGALLAVGDQVSKRRVALGGAPLAVGSLLEALTKAYEVQGILALSTNLHDHGLDHVLLLELASAAVATQLLGGDARQVAAAASNAIADGSTTRVYRHAPRVTWRKSWAAGEAAARAVRYALLAMRGDEGCPRALSAPRWGFQDSLLGGEPLRLERPLSAFVIQEVLFKVPWPAEFHAQTAIEAALQLRDAILPRLGDLVAIEVETQEAGVTILDKQGELRTPADRDHCLQHMVAAAIVFGDLTSEAYEDPAAGHPEVERLRHLITVREHSAYTSAYHDPGRRAVPNAVTARFRDGSASPRVEVVFPLGHPSRRAEALPLLRQKFNVCISRGLDPDQVSTLTEIADDPAQLEATTVPALLRAVSQITNATVPPAQPPLTSGPGRRLG